MLSVVDSFHVNVGRTDVKLNCEPLNGVDCSGSQVAADCGCGTQHE